MEFVARRWEKWDIPSGIFIAGLKDYPSSLCFPIGCWLWVSFTTKNSVGFSAPYFPPFFPFLCNWEGISGIPLLLGCASTGNQMLWIGSNSTGKVVGLGHLSTFLHGAAPDFSRELGMCGDPAGKCCWNFIPIKSIWIQDQQGIILKEHYSIETSSHIQV